MTENDMVRVDMKEYFECTEQTEMCSLICLCSKHAEKSRYISFEIDKHIFNQTTFKNSHHMLISKLKTHCKQILLPFDKARLAVSSILQFLW